MADSRRRPPRSGKDENRNSAEIRKEALEALLEYQERFGPQALTELLREHAQRWGKAP